MAKSQEDRRMEQNILELILEGSMKPTYLPLETLRKITNGFSIDRIIGEGGFGTVYKGVIGNKNVAVKRIRSSMTIDQKLFRREVDSLMEVNHPNVVRFLGLCSHTVEIPMKNPEARGYIYAEIRERLLCFEYVNNGSLDTKITDELRGLEWDRRYQIIKGICTGLRYLHMEKHILHMDLKPANILLDHQMRPKITDFGLSRPTENSQTMTTNRFASLGYTAPENLFGCGRMSVKSDIYSLGTIIIELVTGQKSIPDNNNNILRRWRHRWNKSMKETPQEYHQQVTKCIEIGSLCQKIDPYVRPSISEIMSRLIEIESMNSHDKNANVSIVDQINPAYWEDDMLGVDPLELKFGYNKNHILSCSVQLSNDSDGFIAFKVQTSSPLPYSIEPNKDIVKPRSKCSVDITLLSANAQDHMAAQQYTGEFIVRSIKVRGGLTPKDINQDMFDKHTTGNHVDEIHLVVVSEEPCSEQVVDFSGKQAKKQYISSSEAHEDDKLVKVDTFREDRGVEVDVDATSETTGGSLAVRVAESTSYDSEDLYSPLSSRRLRRTITSWIRGLLLGSGSFGAVYEAISDDGFFFAVKEVSLVEQGINAKQRINQLVNEASLLSLLEHKNIVQYYGTDKDDGKLYIFLELVTQGSLVALYQKYRLQDSQVSAYTRQILNGLNYLHQQNVLHRDIKCANILVDANGLLKLADFGLAKEMSQAKSSKGTVFWMAPEVAKAKPHGPPADIWSLGCTVLEMLTGKVPYPDMEWTHALLKIGRGIPPKVPNELSEDARDFIARCVQANPEDRPSAAELLDHPFVQRPLRH